MKKVTTFLAGMLLLLAVSFAAEPPGPQPREWLINGQANNRATFTGTFVKYESESRLVHVQMPDGFVRKIIAAQLADRDLFYLQRQLCRIPEEIRKPQADMNGKLLVDLSAADLPLGPLKEWKNQGALDGAFHALRTPLTVEELEGRKAVRFYFGPWAAPLDFQAMAADFHAPASVVQDGPFSVVTWIYNPSPLGIDGGRESVLSWHSLAGDRTGTDIGYGLLGRYAIETRNLGGAYAGPLGEFGFPDAVYPAFNQWHHIAYVYSGAEKGVFRIYIDGQLAVEKTVSARPAPTPTPAVAGRTDTTTRTGEGRGGRAGSGRGGRPGSMPEFNPDDSLDNKLLFLGCTWRNRPQTFFTGDIASLKLYSSALSEQEIGALYGRPVSAARAANVPADTAARKSDLYFEPEFDGLVSEPFPKEIRQNGDYGKWMEGWGQPVIAAADCPDEPMRICAYTMAKTLTKRPDIAEVLEALDCAARLDHKGPPWLGYSELVTGCYGQARTFYNDPGFYWGGNIMVHEMGHQFHMFGGEHTDADFRQKLFNVFWRNKKEGRWSGDYGGLNMWEYIAVAASHYVSDGSEEEVICRRETYRKIDPRMFYFLQDYWAGDMLVELLPSQGLHADAAGKVERWDNNGGLEYFGKFGLKKYPRSVGAFEAKGSPTIASREGVTAVEFGGKDALVWNCRTRECLVENRAWSAEFWAYPRSDKGDAVLLSWGPADNGARFLLGGSDKACDLGAAGATRWKNKPPMDEWRHIVYTFKGGGLDNGKGVFRVYVDGKLDHTGEFKLNLPSNQPIIVGGALNGDKVLNGFSGALAHVRVYDYDLSEPQLVKHYNEENSYYKRENPAAAPLFVDLDARMLSTCPEYQFRPIYPKSLGKDWVRAWANRGALAGKMSNDIRAPEGSAPKRASVGGADALSFGGKDRMVSSFVPSEQMLAGPVTLEAWVRRLPEDKNGVILQWGGLVLTGDAIQPGQWRLVSLTIAGNKTELFIDGTPQKGLSGVAMPAKSDRLHFGARWNGNGWGSYFTGAVAQVRVEQGLRTQEEIARNFSASDLLLAMQPSPAQGEKVVTERKVAFSWIPGIGTSGESFDFYLATDPARIASADRKAPCYVGKVKPGQATAPLKPGTTYYWRVDGLDASGKPVSKGKLWSFTTREGLVVDLDASKLKTGAVEVWKNDGRAGGAFKKGTFGDMTAPEVSTVDGRKAVDFTGNKTLLSSFPLPKDLAGDGAFTVAAWAYNAVLDNNETMLSWGAVAGPVAEFGYGRNTDSGAFRCGSENQAGYGGPVWQIEDSRTAAPLVTYWNHIVFVYSGGADGTLRIYVNGIQNNEKKLRVNTSDGSRVALGGVINDLRSRQSSFSGLLSDVSIFTGALSADEVASLFSGAGKAPNASKQLVKLTCAGLPEGKLKAWKNEGAAGGAFTPAPPDVAAPVAEEVAGRRAVTFDGKLAFLQSDVPTPNSVTRINPVTVEAWVYNPQVYSGETVFSLAPRQAYSRVYFEGFIERALEIRYATGDEREPGFVSTGSEVRSLGWKGGKYPAPGAWHHLAFVYDGRHQGLAKVYADGQLVQSLGYYTICTIGGLPMFLGAAWNTDTGAQDMFSGSLASLKVYDYARTDEEISQAAQPR